MSKMQFEAGHARVVVAVQGYLRGSDQKVICGRLLDAGQVSLDRGYDEALIILAATEHVTMISNTQGIIREEDIVAIGRETV